MSRFAMLESLKIISGLIGLSAAALVALAALLRLRAEHSRGWASGDHGAGWFDGLARPVPLLAGGLVLAAVSALLLASVDEDEAGGGDETSVRLLRQLVDSDAQNCREGKPTDGATTVVTCTFADRPMHSLRISLFDSVDALKEVEQDKVEASGMKKVRCGDQRTGWESWRQGILICDYGERGFPSHLRWSRRDSLVLVEAQARDGSNPRGVYDWWLKESNGAPANNRSPYPDRVESDVLRRTGLARGACARVAGFKGSDVSLRCSVPELDYLFIGRYETPDALRRALGDPPGEGSCVPVAEGPEPGRSRYEIRGRPAGTRDCHLLELDDASIVEWTNDRNRLYGYASTTGTSGAELARVFGWWDDTGRFLTD